MKIDNKEIKAVVSDFDGTIIKFGQVLPPQEFFDIVAELLTKGYPFVAASGRQYANLRTILAPIADRIDFIAENGCLIVCKGKVISKFSFEKEQLQELLKDMERYPEAEYLVSGEGTGYVVPHDKDFPNILVERYKNEVTVLRSFDEIEEEIVKLAMHFEGGIPKEAEEWFHKKYDGTIQVVDSGNGWLDFNPKGSSKGAALKILAEHLGISTKEMIAFGDSENDIAMLQEAGVSYAVESAKDHVKEAADHVCESVEEVLKKYLILEQSAY